MDHSDDFYSNFTKILIAAENMGIFILPGEPTSKYSKKNIKKFDNVDSQQKYLYLSLILIIVAIFVVKDLFNLKKILLTLKLYFKQLLSKNQMALCE